MPMLVSGYTRFDFFFNVPNFGYGQRSYDRRKDMKVILILLVAVFGYTHDPIGI